MKRHPCEVLDCKRKISSEFVNHAGMSAFICKDHAWMVRQPASGWTEVEEK